jgi:hypothetical protein
MPRAGVGNTNRYSQIIEYIFLTRYHTDDTKVCFEREDIERTTAELDLKLPKNLGDLVYSFRYRTLLPAAVQRTAPDGYMWIIRPAGRAKYCFDLVRTQALTPNPMLIETKVPDATPGIVAKYSFNDEQALLARLRYNRLIDIFTGTTCYSLQNHLRTTIPEFGQIETDEVYVGVDRRGAHYIFPVQAKGGTDRLSIVQIEQDFGLCSHKYPELICRPIGAQFMSDSTIVLFELEQSEEGIKIAAEKHYRLVPPDEVNSADLEQYRNRPFEG